jgi:hypothetical protein
VTLKHQVHLTEHGSCNHVILRSAFVVRDLRDKRPALIICHPVGQMKSAPASWDGGEIAVVIGAEDPRHPKGEGQQQLV